MLGLGQWDAFVYVGELSGGWLGSSSVERATVRGSVSTMMAPNWGTRFDVLSDFADVSGSILGAIDAADFRSSANLLGVFAHYRNIGGGTESTNA